MDLKDRVMDILEGRAKMGAGVTAGRKRTKPKTKRSAGVTAGRKKTRKRKPGYKMSVPAPRGPIQQGLSRSHRGGQQMSKSKGGVRAAGVRAGVRAGKPKQSRWIKHVKKVQRETGLPYKEAMVEASKTYVKKAKPKKVGTKPKVSAKSKAKARNNPWIQYVKEFAKLNQMTYADALMAAGPYYRGEAK